MRWKAENLKNFHRIVESLKLGSEEMFELKLLGVDKGEKELAKKFFKVNKLSAVAEDKASNFILLKRLKLSDSEIQKVLDLADVYDLYSNFYNF